MKKNNLIIITLIIGALFVTQMVSARAERSSATNNKLGHSVIIP